MKLSQFSNLNYHIFDIDKGIVDGDDLALRLVHRGTEDEATDTTKTKSSLALINMLVNLPVDSELEGGHLMFHGMGDRDSPELYTIFHEKLN